MKPLVDFATFSALDIRVGTIIACRPFERAHKPAYRLSIDFGEQLGTLHTSAQLTHRYAVGELKNKKVVAVVNFPEKDIAGFKSQCLVLGAIGEDGDVSLLAADEPIENGQIIG
ncbi:TPA: tRNA-binding protein [Candidatus Saccharibacteria bacterium]|nr:tRNA-binding protein [Candidatus Saccharibacteria bacterium]HIO87338.1 tRNA-binding protein [Candidatus Saccharibacteria bacterium]